MVGILCVALLDFFRVINIHDRGAGVIYNAVLAAFCYGLGGAVALIGRQAVLRVWRRISVSGWLAIWLKTMLDRLWRSVMELRTRCVRPDSHMQDDFSRLQRLNGK